MNASPTGSSITVWFACYDALPLVEGGLAFWRARAPLPDDAPSGDDPQAQTRWAVERWAAGPTDEERALGLIGGFEPGVSLTSVTFEGARVLVDVTPEPGSEASWSTSNESMFHAMGMAAAALQLSEFDELLFTTNGRCEEFTLMTEVLPCFVYTAEYTPWRGDPDQMVSSAIDGRHASTLRIVETEKRALGFDIVQWLTGEQANTAFRTERPEDGPRAPNDYWVRDEDHATLVLDVADDVRVRFGLTPDGEAGTWEGLPEHLAPRTNGEVLGGSVFWIEILDGVIVAIEEQWVP